MALVVIGTMSAKVVKTTQFQLLISHDDQRSFHQIQGEVVTGIVERGLGPDQPPVMAKNRLAFVGKDVAIVVVVVRQSCI